MIYRAIGLMSGSSLDGLDIAFVEIHESGRKWGFEILHAECYPYSPEWQERLQGATSLSAYDYLLLHTAYGRYLGEQVNRFIAAHNLDHRVQLIASHGHTVFHDPANRMTAQLGDGAALAAVTGLNVISDLRAVDVALGGQGAPIVPIGEKLLLPGYDFYLNLGGIANLSAARPDSNNIAFDVCPANKVLNLLVKSLGKSFDDNGTIAAGGKCLDAVLADLNRLPYYTQDAPKSLANEFGSEIVFPMLQQTGISTADALNTMVHHVVDQVCRSVQEYRDSPEPKRLLVTGGGALNGFMTGLLSKKLAEINVELVIPDATLIEFKEAVVMALIGVLRWRQDENILASVTGAERDSINGAWWSAL